MPTKDIIGLRKKTLNITNKFFKDIKEFIPGKDNYELQIYPRVQKFFTDMNKLDKKQFAYYLAQQRYTCNINSNDVNEKTRNQDVFRCLVALIIYHHSESDIVRYFFPNNFREKVGSPTYSSDSWRIAYWCQALSYWFGQLFGERKYQISSLIDTNNRKAIHDALKEVCNGLKSNDYIALIHSDSAFCQHLDVITGYILRIKNPTPISIGDLSIRGPSMFSISKSEISSHPSADCSNSSADHQTNVSPK